MEIMKHHLNILPVAIATLSLAACGGTTSAPEHSAPVFATDSIGWADSVVTAGCKAKIEIKGLYPATDTSALADSVRAWIGERLARAVADDFGTGHRLSTGDLQNGQALIDECGAAIAKMSENDFAEFAREKIAIEYEFQSSFRPVYSSDSLLSYSFSDYIYLGGAHGGSLGAGQTFNANTGERLTEADIFEPEKMPAVVELVKKALWDQYFKENASEGATLADVLLINPDTLRLPAYPPVFDAEGLVFTYQQYEIACYADGMPSCTIPYSTLRPLMRPRTAALLSSRE